MEPIKPILTNWILDRKRVLIDNYTKKNIRASGRFADSLNVEVTDNSVKLAGNKYIGGVIFGRRPNTNSSPEAIEKWSRGMAWTMSEWVQKKGGEGGWFHGYSIAKKIATQGWTIPNKHGNDGKLLTDTFTEESIKDLTRQVGNMYFTDIKQITQQIFERK